MLQFLRRVYSFSKANLSKQHPIRLRCSGLVGLPQDESLRFMAVAFACWLFSFVPERRDATGFHLWIRAERKWFTCFVSKK